MAQHVHGLTAKELANRIVVNGRAYYHEKSKVIKGGEDGINLLKLHPAQSEPFFSKARYRVVVAGRRWGKTHWTCIELIMAARKKSNQRVWYIAPTYSMARQIAWEKLKEILPRSWIAKTNETLLQITLINGSTISLKGADRPDTLRGVGIHFLVLDEYQDFKPGTWEQVLRPTLSDTRGRGVFIGTPKSFNQLYEMYERGQGKNPQWASWQFRTIDSPFIPKTEVEAAREDLDPKTFRQEYEASFESMAGRVYYDFTRENVQPCPYEPSLPIWIGQDFNVDPMSSIIFQKRGEELWAVGEISLRSSSTEDVCKEIIDQYGWAAQDKCTIYPDPAGTQRSSTRGESDIQIFREWGFKRILHRRKHPSVRDRIASVNRMICNAKGERSLKVDPSCEELIKCFDQLVYKDGTSEPDKRMNIEHMGDAAGYAIEYEFPIKRNIGVVGYSH